MKKKILFSFIVLVLLLFISDILVGYFLDIKKHRVDFNSFLQACDNLKPYTKVHRGNMSLSYHCDYRPEGDLFYKHGSKISFRTDSKGYILGNNKNNKSKKVLFIGGSTTECFEVDEEHRFPNKTHEVLEKKYSKKIETFNYGVRGHTTQDSILLTMYLHRYLRPNYIVLMHNLNDRSWLSLNGGYITYPKGREYSSYDLVVGWFKRNTNIGFKIVNSLQRSGKIGLAMEGSHSPPGELGIQPGPPDSNLFVENLLIFTNLCRSIQVEPILMTQPLGYEDKDHIKFNNLIREFCKTNNVILIDIDKDADTSRKGFFYDDQVHYSNIGSLEISKVIAKNLNEILKDED